MIETAIPVRFNEVDQMQVVHHSQYYVYMEVARFQFARHALGVTHEDLVNWQLQVPVRRCQCEYLWPARFGDTVLVRITLKPVETASLHLRYQIRRESDGRLLARGETVNVFIDMAGKLRIRMPEILRQRIVAAVAQHPEIVEG